VKTQLRGTRVRASFSCVVAITACLAVAGCSSSGGTATRPETPARLRIVAPVPNARTGANVELTLRLDHARLVTPIEGLAVVPERGHVHVSVDGQLVAMPSALHVAVPGLTKGQHTISAEFVASDHLPFRNRVVAAVTFRVG
jgi:hypothetical protein